MAQEAGLHRDLAQVLAELHLSAACTPLFLKKGMTTLAQLFLASEEDLENMGVKALQRRALLKHVDALLKHPCVNNTQ